MGGTISLSGIEDLTINGNGDDDTMNVAKVGGENELQYVYLNFEDDSDLNVTGRNSADDNIFVTPTATGAGYFMANDIQTVTSTRASREPSRSTAEPAARSTC